MLTRPQRAALAAIVAAGADGAHHNPDGKGYGARVAHGTVIDSLITKQLVRIGDHPAGLQRTCRNGNACWVLVATVFGREALEKT